MIAEKMRFPCGKVGAQRDVIRGWIRETDSKQGWLLRFFGAMSASQDQEVELQMNYSIFQTTHFFNLNNRATRDKKLSFLEETSRTTQENYWLNITERVGESLNRVLWSTTKA